MFSKTFRDLQELEICQHGGRESSSRPLTKESRPDAVIVRRDRLPLLEEANAYWGSVEMAIGYCSAGESREQCLEEVISYVGYLLEARPELVSALGLLVEPGCLSFLLCNTDEIKKLSVSTGEELFSLLLVVMKYLNGGQEKNLDSTLSRGSGPNLFDVIIPNESSSLEVSEGRGSLFKNCTLRWSHDPFGRRSNIFITERGTPVHATRVIKDQYIRKNRRWTEKEILHKIHATGTYPAVVTMSFAGTLPEAGCGDLIKVRIVLQDHGTDSMSLKTPRDVIYALYDLLEVTRGLYFDRKILHRDISPWNIMIRETGDAIPATDPSSSPVFIRHLLDPQVHKQKSSVFLIDFDYSQDLESSKASLDERTGTPMFIARAVQAGKPLPHNRYTFFPPLPHLSEKIRPVYETSIRNEWKCLMEHSNLSSDHAKILLPLPSSTNFSMMQSQASGHSFGGVSWLHPRMQKSPASIL